MADNVKLVLEFDSTGAIAGVKNFGTTLKSQTKEAESAFDGLNGKLVAVGAAIATYFTVGAIKNFFGAIISESMDAEKQLNQLNGALQRAGTYTAESSKAMTDYATAMMGMTTIDDDVIIGQLAIARNFTKTDEEARKLVTSASDLAAAMDIDLGTAVEQLGKTMDGTAGRLNETVPALRSVSAEALKAGAAIDVVGKAFEGAAANKVKTFEGAMLQLSNSFGNLKAALGDIITQNPMVIAAINELSKLFITLQEKITGNKDASTSWVSEGILGMINGIRSLLPYLNNLISFFKMLYAQIIFIKNGWMAFLESIGLVAIAFPALWEKMAGGSKNMTMFAEIMKDMTARANETEAAFKNMFKDTFNDKDFAPLDAALKRISDAAKDPALAIKVKIDTQEMLNMQQMKDAIQKLKDEAWKEMQYKDEGMIKDPNSYQDPTGPEKPKKTLAENMPVFSFTEGLITIFSPLIIAWDQAESTLKKSGAAILATSPILSKSFDEIASVYKIGLKVVLRIVDKLPTIFDEISNLNFSKYQVSQFSYAYEKSISEGNNKIIATLSGFKSSLESLSLASTFKNIGDAMQKLGQKALNITENLIAGAVGGGVAVAGQSVTSTVSNIGKGEAGAMPAIVETIGAMGTAFDKALGTGTAIGDILKSFLNQLSDPKQIGALVNGFIAAIPNIIDSFITSLPVLMDGIIRALPVLIDGIIRLIPVLFKTIAEGIGPILIMLAEKIPDILIAILNNIPQIIVAISDALPDIITKLIEAMPALLTALARAFVNVLWTLLINAIPGIIVGVVRGCISVINNLLRDYDVGKALKGGASKAQENLDPKKLIDQLKNAVYKLAMFIQTDAPRYLVQGVQKLLTFLSTLPNMLWTQGILPLVNWIAQLPNQIYTQGILPLVTWLSTLPSVIYNQGILPIVNWFAQLPIVIYKEGILQLILFFCDLGARIWNNSIIPLINFFGNLGARIWNSGVIPLVNFFGNLGAKIWNSGIIPLINFFADLPNKLMDALSGGGGKGGNFFSNAGSQIAGVFGFAEGGTVPGGYPNDSYPALLTSGETILPGKSADSLFKAIDIISKGNGGQSNAETNALLRQLISLIASQETTVNVQLDRNVLAKAILTLNKDNRRIA